MTLRILVQSRVIDHSNKPCSDLVTACITEDLPYDPQISDSSLDDGVRIEAGVELPSKL